MKRQLLIALTLALTQNALCMEAQKTEEITSGNIALQTNLMHALKNRFYSSASQLINAGIPLNNAIISQLSDQNIAQALLKAAVRYQHEHTLEVLLANATIDLEVKDEEGNTALAYAVWKGNRKLVELLYTKGANINTQNRYGLTPLMLALSYHSDPDFVKWFLQLRPNKKIKSNCGETAYHYAKGSPYRDIYDLADLL